jgi:hypothetical protein
VPLEQPRLTRSTGASNSEITPVDAPVASANERLATQNYVSLSPPLLSPFAPVEQGADDDEAACDHDNDVSNNFGGQRWVSS